MARPTRRDVLQVVAGTAAASLVSPSRGRAADGRPAIRSCILLFHYGGPSHLETFDPKPEAPSEVRGEYGVIDTAVPGLRISEHLRLTSRLMDRVALVRSVHHPMRNHNAAAAETLTGRTPTGGDLELLADEAQSYPTLGSAVSYGLGSRANILPYVALPYTMYNVVQLPGQTPGFLGGTYDRFQLTGNPNQPNFSVSVFDPPEGRGGDALRARRALLHALDAMPRDARVAKVQTYQERALQLLGSEATRQAFDVGRETPEIRERYGRNLLGQSVLLARRLVEGGVNFVSVFNGQRNGQEANWDSHTNLFPRHLQLIPPADQAYSALLEDLEARGLLDSTLVIWMAEFGRTPKINGNAGRDHWPDCYTVALAGGGVRGGQVHGASDKIAAYPDHDPVTPSDLAATLFWRFGIDPALEMHDQTGRPLRLADGQPVTALF